MAAPVSHGGQVGIKIDGKRALAKLARVGALISVRQLLEGIGQKELRWVGLNLEQAGDLPDGAPWQRMSPITIHLRPLRKSPFHFSSPYQTLLQQSFVSEVHESTSSVEVGTNARYALDHHLGIPSRNLPARKLLPAADVAKRHALDFVKAVIKQVQAAGR